MYLLHGHGAQVPQLHSRQPHRRWELTIHLDVRSVRSPAIRTATELRHVREFRAVQKERFAELDKPGDSVNGDMGVLCMGGPCVGLSEVQKYCTLDEGCAAACKNLMRAPTATKSAIVKLHFSP